MQLIVFLQGDRPDQAGRVQRRLGIVRIMQAVGVARQLGSQINHGFILRPY